MNKIVSPFLNIPEMCVNGGMTDGSQVSLQTYPEQQGIQAVHTHTNG